MIRILRVLILFFVCITSTQHVYGQKREVTGRVVDDATGEPLQYVSVSLKDTQIGTTTGFDGSFALKIKRFPCELNFRFIGYVPVKQIIRKSDSVVIRMREDVQLLSEVVVKPDYSYDYYLLSKIIKNRRFNDPDLLEGITFKDYSRTSVFLTGIKERWIRKSRILSKSKHAFVAESDSTVRMPFLFVEQLLKHVRDSAADNETIVTLADSNATIFPDVGNEIASIVMDKVTTNINFYRNKVDILTRSMPSPIATSTKLYYNVYLIDSVMKNNAKQYKFSFYPKTKKLLAFKGYFWADSTDWALTDIYAEVPNSANINFVSNLSVRQTFAKDSHGRWFYDGQTVKMDLSVFTHDTVHSKKRRMTFAVGKTSAYYLDEAIDSLDNAVPAKDNDNSNNNDPAPTLLSDYRTELDTFESKAFNGIRTIENNNYFKFANKVAAFAMFSYFNLGYIDVGPHYMLYYNNAIEGPRISLPLRTSSKLSKKFVLSGYVGYGFTNRKLAYGGNTAYQFRSKKRSILWLNYRHDYTELTYSKFMEFIKENPFQRGKGNFISPFTVITPNPYLVSSDMLNITWEKDLTSSVGILVRPAAERFYNNENLGFCAADEQQTTINNFTTYTLMLNVRMSHDRTFDDEFFARVYYGNDLPVYNISVLTGRYDLPAIRKNGLFANINASIKQRVNVSNHLLMIYLFEAGGIVGRVPFPLLNMPQGSGDLGFARFNFNLLHHSSFISDVYASMHLFFNTYGFIFNHIPLIKRLNLREVFSFKAYYGRLLSNHNAIMPIPDFMTQTPMKMPYMEAGIGITNIFKCLRIEYCFRINQGEFYDKIADKWGIRLRFEVTF